MQNKKWRGFALTLIAFGCLSAAVAGTWNGWGYHPVRTDSNGYILPWYSSNLGQSYDHDLILIWNYWKNMELCPNGVKYYLQHQVYKPNHNDWRGLGGDQLNMAMSSWRLLYAYTGDTAVRNDMIYMADFFLAHSLTPSNAVWPNIPYTYNSDPDSGVYDGDMMMGLNITQPDKAGSFGYELVMLYEMTGDIKYMNAAIKIAETLASMTVAGDNNNSPLPFKVNALTGTVMSTYTSNWVPTVQLFEELARLNRGNPTLFTQKANLIKTWFKTYPLNTNKWGPFFEDVDVWSDTSINAVTLAWYILEHPSWGATQLADARKIMDYTFTTFHNNNFLQQYNVVTINEQTAYMVNGNSHTSRYASIELLYSEKSGNTAGKAAAVRQLNWATYMVDDTGANQYPENDIWLTDGYGDYVRHYLRAMGAAPELSPDNKDRLVRTSSVVKTIAYGTNQISYSTYDAASTEVLRINSFVPAVVTSGGQTLVRRSTVAELNSADGYTLGASGDLPSVLRVRHSGSGDIVISQTGSASSPSAPKNLRIIP